VAANFARSLEVLRGLGAHIGEVEPLAGIADDWRGLIATLLTVEGATYIEPVLRSRPQAIGAFVRGRFEAALETPVAQYVRALEFRKQVQHRYEAALDGFDAYVLPTSVRTAEPIAEDPNNESPPPDTFRNTSVFDHSHQPSISVPNGFDDEGLPTGLMISGRLFDDARVLGIAHAYQQATVFHRLRPEL
jgi:aspartyl-tRNA(Asn)/glutamyl-tRNA(Gln) amidotransferase subunit A